MKVLIIYEHVPEKTTFYSVEVDAQDWAWMKLTHGNFVNNDMPEEAEDACNKLSDWLTGKKPMDAPEPILMRGEGYDYVLHTGFLM